MRLLNSLLLVLAGLLLLAYGGIGLLFTLGPGGDAGAIAFTGGCAIAGLALLGLALRRLLQAR